MNKHLAIYLGPNEAMDKHRFFEAWHNVTQETSGTQPTSTNTDITLCLKFRCNWKCRIGFKCKCGATPCHVEWHGVSV